MSNTYFTQDGTYGDAEDILVVDTTNWTEDDWERVGEVPDSIRLLTAYNILREKAKVK